jgi:hypothetical protein
LSAHRIDVVIKFQHAFLRNSVLHGHSTRRILRSWSRPKSTGVHFGMVRFPLTWRLNRYRRHSTVTAWCRRGHPSYKRQEIRRDLLFLQER